jgi:hypothetical protein
MDRVPNLQVIPMIVSGQEGQATHSSHSSLLAQLRGEGQSTPGATPPSCSDTSANPGNTPQLGVEMVWGRGINGLSCSHIPSLCRLWLEQDTTFVHRKWLKQLTKINTLATCKYCLHVHHMHRFQSRLYIRSLINL